MMLKLESSTGTIFRARIRRIPQDIQQQIRARQILRLKDMQGAADDYEGILDKIRKSDEFCHWVVGVAKPEIIGMESDLDTWMEHYPEYVQPLANAIVESITPNVTQIPDDATDQIETKKNST